MIVTLSASCCSEQVVYTASVSRWCIQRGHPRYTPHDEIDDKAMFYCLELLCCIPSLDSLLPRSELALRGLAGTGAMLTPGLRLLWDACLCKLRQCSALFEGGGRTVKAGKSTRGPSGVEKTRGAGSGGGSQHGATDDPPANQNLDSWTAGRTSTADKKELVRSTDALPWCCGLLCFSARMLSFFEPSLKQKRWALYCAIATSLRINALVEINEVPPKAREWMLRCRRFYTGCK